VTFKTQWQPAARDELAELWLNAATDTRREITVAAREIDLALQHSPQDVGESRSDGRRIVFAAPLAVVFEVEEPACVVRVLKVWCYGT
jgi:hypothetical protein